MNKRKGFFRLTLVLSFLFGIMTLYFSEDIFKDPVLGEGVYKKVKIPLPSGWRDKILQEKLDMIDELDTKMRDWETKRIQEEKEKEKKADEQREKADEQREKVQKKREKAGPTITPAPPGVRIPPSFGTPDTSVEDAQESLDELRERMSGSVYIDYYKLSPKEKLNVKKQLRMEIISDEKEMPKHRRGRNYYVSLAPDWKKISFTILAQFTIGFALVWLIYAFIRWVIIGFIMGGFKYKSTP